MKLLIIALFTISFNLFSQEINNKVFDEKFNDSLLVGECNINAFRIAPYNNWFNDEYNDYEPNDSVINLLKTSVKNVNITIILGVWCSDSRREFPRFIKILDLIGFDYSKLTIIAVNTKKDAVFKDISNYNIELIPTLIFYEKETELGRIIETPQKTLENDLLTFIN